MHRGFRPVGLLVFLLAGLCLLLPLPAGPAAAADDPECPCEEGPGACQHFLRNPAGPTDDPCWCDRCESGRKHDGVRAPDKCFQLCHQSNSMSCYLKRHALAWGITCSACVVDETCCPFKNKQNCPDCGPDSSGDPLERDCFGKDAKEVVLGLLEKDKRHFKKPDELIVAYDKRFYIATDIDGLKVRMPSGTARLISRHEWVHLMLERAEYARREWVRALGEPMMDRPSAMYFPAKQRDAEKVAAAYFGSPNSNILSGSGGRVTDGFCTNGFQASEDKYGGDHDLHVEMRHSLAHLFFSCWRAHSIHPKAMPVWMTEGLAHWLTKNQKRFRDDAVFCQGEGSSATGGSAGGATGRGGGGGGFTMSGKGWDKDLRGIATDPKLEPIERLLGKVTVKELTADDYKRVWSWLDLCLTEWREPFVAMMSDIRKEVEMREAFTKNLGCTPEIFDQRWRERVTGKRRSMAPTAAEGEPEANDAPGARDRQSLLSEQDPKTLAAKLRALGVVAEKRTLQVVIDLLARNSDLVRETALVTLLKTQDPDCRDTLTEYGLTHTDPIARAYVARVCGRIQLDAAAPRLRLQLADDNWYARAEAAVALGMLKDIDSMSGMRKIISGDTSEKAKVAAMDALAMFGEDAQSAAPVVGKHLDSPQWQIRVAACQALGAFGSMEAVEPLIVRLEKETGPRVTDEIHSALCKITRDDLGRNPGHWRKWWEKEKANTPNGLPQRPEEKKGPKDGKPNPDDRYAAARYYGVEIFSNRIGYVIDTSQSMAVLFSPDPAAAKVLSREYTGFDKLTICKEEIAQSLRSLDPRSHFSIVSFGTSIREFKARPVPASPSNIDSAIGFMKSLPASGETNYYDSLRKVLDLGDEPDTNANFRATPDTITFLTDGRPTKGEMLDADTLLEWYTGLNRYARVKTHTITFGLLGIDMPLLRNMAEKNGGVFLIVPERKP